MRILHVCSELFPLLKTGGLADVVGALPKAQIEAGAEARLLLPAFPALQEGIKKTQLVASLDTFAGRVSLHYGHYNGVDVYLIDAPHLYGRLGSPYHDSYQTAYHDNHLRFALLGWIAAEMACGLDGYWRPDIIHAHDWHAGLACAYLAARGRPARSVFTIHNLAYQGNFSAQHLTEISLPGEFFQMRGLEYYHQISFLKAGLFYADHVTTVSPTYAQEITQAEFGYGLHELLQERQHQGCLSGILNGIDTECWDPAQDPQLVSHYNAKQLKNKTANKIALQTEMKLNADAKKPLFAVVSRLTEQKGLDLVLATLPTLLSHGGQLVVLGSGDLDLQEQFLTAAKESPDQLAVHIGYDENLAHRIIGGADVIMVPSRFEPCGLTQLYGLRYGTLPLARCTGGLADTVIDTALENLVTRTANGFLFYDFTPKALDSAIRRAFALWKQPALWQRVQRYAMKQNVSWLTSAQSYLSLYQRLL